MSEAAPSEVSIVVPTIGRTACSTHVCVPCSRAARVRRGARRRPERRDDVADLIDRTGGAQAAGEHRARDKPGDERGPRGRDLRPRGRDPRRLRRRHRLGRAAERHSGDETDPDRHRTRDAGGGGPAPCRPSRPIRSPHDFTGERHVRRAVPATTWPSSRDGRPRLRGLRRAHCRYAPRTTTSATAGCAPGGALRYSPEMVVWHRDWRPRTSSALYRALLALPRGSSTPKHLPRARPAVLRFIADDPRGPRCYGGRRRSCAAARPGPTRAPGSPRPARRASSPACGWIGDPAGAPVPLTLC